MLNSKGRHLIEYFLYKLKEFKRLALRADKTDQSFAAMIHLAAAVINSRLNLNRSENAMNEAQHSPTIGRLIGFLAFLGLALLPSLTSAEPLTQCKRGLRVLDSLGNPIGQVIGDRDGSCLVKSRDGRLQRWVPVGELSAAPPEEPIGSKKTPEPELSEGEPAPPQSDEIGQGGYSIRVAAGIPDNPLPWPPICSEKTRSATGPISAEPKESGSDRTGNPPRAGSTSGRAERDGELANASPHGIPLKRSYPRAAIQVLLGQHGALRVAGTALIYAY